MPITFAASNSMLDSKKERIIMIIVKNKMAPISNMLRPLHKAQDGAKQHRDLPSKVTYNIWNDATRDDVRKFLRKSRLSGVPAAESFRLVKECWGVARSTANAWLAHEAPRMRGRPGVVDDETVMILLNVLEVLEAKQTTYSWSTVKEIV